MYPLHVLSHLVSAAELLGTVHTWNLFPLRWASTIRPSQMIFQIFENLATKFTVFQCFLCVSSFEVLSHFHRNICFVITHGALHRLVVIVNPVNVEVQGCFGGLPFTRQNLAMPTCQEIDTVLQYIEDYINIPGLRLWQEEISRIINHAVEKEAAGFLKNAGDSYNQYQSLAVPIPEFSPVQGDISRLNLE